MLCPSCLTGNVIGAKKCYSCGDYFKLKDTLRHEFFSISSAKWFLSIVLSFGLGFYSANYGHELGKKYYEEQIQKEEDKEVERILSLLVMEFNQNYDVFSHNDEWVQKDVGAIQQGIRQTGSVKDAKPTLIDLQRFQFSAWQIVRASSVFLNYFSERDLIILYEYYKNLEELNNMVLSRENFKIENYYEEGMASVQTILDENINAISIQFAPSVFATGDLLYANNTWKESKRRLLW